MSNNQIRLTEEELHMLVEDAVNTYLINEVGQLGGIKNAWHGMFGKNPQTGKRNWNYHLGRTYKAGKTASSFQKYVSDAKKAISNLINIAQYYDSGSIVDDLYKVSNNLQTLANDFNEQASYTANHRNDSGIDLVDNPWEWERMDQRSDTERMQRNYEDMIANQRMQNSDLQNSMQALRNQFNSEMQTLKQQHAAQLAKEKQNLNNIMTALQNNNGAHKDEVEKMKQKFEDEKQKYAADLQQYNNQVAQLQAKMKAKGQKLRQANAKIKNYKAAQQQQQQGQGTGQVGQTTPTYPGYGTSNPYITSNGYT